MAKNRGTHKQAIADRLAEIAERNGGRLLPDHVVEDARNPKSPLHGEFQWDVKKAAYEHWLDRARKIISEVRYVHRTERYTIECTAYVRDPSCAAKEQGYSHVSRVRTSQDQARDVLLEEFGRVAAMLRRAREVAKVLELEDEIEPLLNGALDFRAKLEVVSTAQ